MPLAWEVEPEVEPEIEAGAGAEAEAGVEAEAGAEAVEAAAFAALHEATDRFARTALAAVVARSRCGHGDGAHGGARSGAHGGAHGGEGAGGAAGAQPLRGVTAPPIAGCVVSMPAASAQEWHSDGAEEGLYNVFVPLVPLTPRNGPTELRPGSHLWGGNTWGHVAPRLAPLLGAGDVLIFDYRLRHRGLANNSSRQRAVAYVTYACGEAADRNFPSATTLAWD